MKILYVIFAICLLSISVDADGEENVNLFKSVEFVGVYKADGSRECVFFVGSESYIDKVRKKVASSSSYPFHFILITKEGGSVSELIKGFDSQLDSSMRSYSNLKGLSVAEIIVKVAGEMKPLK